MEIWKPVIGFEGMYEVSSAGRVRSLDKRVPSGIRHNTTTIKYGRVLKQNLKRNGYVSVVLAHQRVNKTISTHRLVAKAYIPNPNEKPMVNHRNGDKTDNRVENLEWCTAEENVAHATQNNLLSPSSLRKPLLCVETKQTFDSSYQAAQWLNKTKYQFSKKVDVMARSIRAASSKKRKTAFGYHWSDIQSTISSTTSP